VREAIFDILGSQGGVVDVRVVDLFCGSGALGLEALSRGAASATFVDLDPDALAAVRQNLDAVGLADADVSLVRAALPGWLLGPGPTAKRTFDLALCDPPYDFVDWPALLEALDAETVVMESSSPIALPDTWVVARERRYGGTLITVAHQRGDAAAHSAGGRGRMKVGLFPGSFDPFHNGHLEIVERASKLFDEVVVAAVRNPQKGTTLFDLEEREELLEKVTAHLPSVRIVSMSTLTVWVARDVGANAIIRGLRAVSDFEAEMQMAQMNNHLSGVETIFIPTSAEWSFLASKLVREVWRFGGDVSAFVPEPVAKALAIRYKEEGEEQ
jgi:pantetheine-phosphate adenylyltransferase